MTTIVERIPLSRRRAFSSRAQAMVVIGLAPAAAHMAHPSSAGALLGAVPFLAALVAFGIAFPGLPRPLAAWGAFFAGTLALADGGIHVDNLVAGGELGAGNALGLATGLGGLALLGAALATVLRPKPARSRTRRWATRLGAFAVVPVTLVFAIMPLFVAFYATHKPAVDVLSSDLRVAHEDVTLHASDGVELPAWFIPSRNGRAVILVHGSGGNRNGGIKSRAEMLARNGYGVLVYDARRGDGLGWSWYRDVYGAIAFLEERGFDKIGALGLSTGADAVLEAAGRDRRIDAVVAEGAQARMVGELRGLSWGVEKAFLLQQFSVATTTYRALTRQAPPERLQELIPRIAPRPVFLMSAGAGYEARMNRIYRDAASGPVELWEMTDAPHTGGMKSHAPEYERRVVDFFDSAL